MKLKVTEEEKEILINEIAERMKDVIYIDAKEEARKVLECILEKDFQSSSDTIRINFEFRFSYGDLVQILGRKRRGVEDK